MGLGEHGRAARAPGGRDRAVVPGDARALALRPAAAEGELQRRRGRPGRASSSWRTTPTCCSTGARRPRRGARPTSRSASPTSRASRDGHDRVSATARPDRADGGTPPAAAASPKASSAVHIWLMAARLRTLPAAVAPVLVGTSLALGDGHFHPLAFVAALLGAVFIQVGHQPVQRLLRRAPGRRHRGSTRPGAGDRRRARAARQGPVRNIRDVRACGPVRHLPGGGRGLGADRGRRRVDPRGRALHGRPPPLRLRGPRRAVRVPVLRDRGRERLLLRAGPGTALGGLRVRGARWACSRARSSW